jgi:hypothetical protein
MTAPSTNPVNVARRAARQARAALHPVPETPAATAALAALVYIPPRRAALDAEELAAVDAALRAGVTWEKIAAALGYNSRQAARQRWQRLHDRTTRTSGQGDEHQDEGQGDAEHGPAGKPAAPARPVERHQPKHKSRRQRRK